MSLTKRSSGPACGGPLICLVSDVGPQQGSADDGSRHAAAGSRKPALAPDWRKGAWPSVPRVGLGPTVAGVSCGMAAELWLTGRGSRASLLAIR